jgi:hypothetical protein
VEINRVFTNLAPIAAHSNWQIFSQQLLEPLPQKIPAATANLNASPLSLPSPATTALQPNPCSSTSAFAKTEAKPRAVSRFRDSPTIPRTPETLTINGETMKKLPEC